MTPSCTADSNRETTTVPKSRSHIRCASLIAVLITGGLLLTGCSSDADTSLPSCPVSHGAAVDMVPSGARPCVLYGAGKSSGQQSGSGARQKGTSPASKPGKAAKRPAAPKLRKGPATTPRRR